MSEMALPGVFKGSNTIYHSASSNGTSTPQQNGRHIVNGAPSSASSSLGNDSSSGCPPETEVTCSVATMPAIQPKQEVEDTDTAHTDTAKEDVKEESQPEVDIVINNVVCSFSVRCHLNLKEIALNGSNVEYRKENGMVTMKLRLGLVFQFRFKYLI